tara:strand:- start:538 stop:675 length:138 start_codon:yes stop_codon:yes gene_type:complete
MVSTRDLESVVLQINTQFDDLRNKIAKLEEELKCQSQGKAKPKSK